jgi:hypothetical protein
MALVTTTLSAAVAAGDNVINVASATSVSAGRLVLVDQEIMVVTKAYTSGTAVPVLRGREGTVQAAHVITANVVHGDAADFGRPAGGAGPTYGVMRPVLVRSVTATSSLELPPPGCDLRVILNGTSVITLTIPVPTAELDGTMLTIISNGAAAHVPTFTGGLGGAGTSYDAITNNATGKFALTVFAANGTWQIPQAPALSGTVTNITGGIA